MQTAYVYCHIFEEINIKRDPSATQNLVSQKLVDVTTLCRVTLPTTEQWTHYFYYYIKERLPYQICDKLNAVQKWRVGWGAVFKDFDMLESYDLKFIAEDAHDFCNILPRIWYFARWWTWNDSLNGHLPKNCRIMQLMTWLLVDSKLQTQQIKLDLRRQFHPRFLKKCKFFNSLFGNGLGVMIVVVE